MQCKHKMCGIWALVGEPKHPDIVTSYLDNLRQRGPEGSKLVSKSRFQLGFTRLALNGLGSSGMQPMKYSNTYWICNGEIYNWKSIAENYGITNKSGSDCEILGEYLSNVETVGNFFRGLHGVFACVIVDRDLNRVIVGRDPYGVRPLYISRHSNYIVMASELKALPPGHVEHFPPGHYSIIHMTNLEGHTVKYHYESIYHIEDAFATLRNSLIRAVKIRMMTERPIAALLSGGLDSSLIAAILQHELRLAHKPSLQTFSIGFEGSEDLRNARLVANHIGSIHTEIIMTPSQFFEAIRDVIYDIESYDITTVRASVGNWLLGREIANRTDCKVVFNGDGSDELFGGYLYFHKSPSRVAFEKECRRLLEDIHMFDVLRSDRCISSHGLEPRTPFLDKEFVNVVKSIPLEMRRPTSTQVEKWVLRKSFDFGLLPKEVLWRKKEAFSDGVSGSNGISWYQECQSRALSKVPGWQEGLQQFTYLQPYTAESFYYRSIFQYFYPDFENVVPYFWMPKWSPETTDPSARTLDNPSTMNAS